MSTATIKISRSLEEIGAHEWNSLVPPDMPTLSFEFLDALEQSGCVSRDTGWSPHHITIHDGHTTVAAVPCYLKYHSWGEFIFDWAWANAYQQAGLEYYPKLLIAVPYTPITGPRLLAHPDTDRKQIEKQIVEALIALADETEASSIHWLFTTAQETQQLAQAGLLPRVSNQFHWHNESYTTFSDFTGALSAKKRKNIARERRRVRDAGVCFSWRTGHDADCSDWQHFYRCYRNTIDEHGSLTYLNLDFFLRLATQLPDSVRLLLAEKQGTAIAAAFFLYSGNTLCGRYWGTLQSVTDLHFETCYYQPIEYCINHSLKHFEAGAQGEHKLSRGLLPRKVYSAHWLRHAGFYDAIQRYTMEEADHVARYIDALAHHSPFRKA